MYIYLYACVCVCCTCVWVGTTVRAQTAEGSCRGHSGLVYLRRLALIVPGGVGESICPRVLLDACWLLRRHRGHLLTFSAQLGIYVILPLDGYHRRRNIKSKAQSSDFEGLTGGLVEGSRQQRNPAAAEPDNTAAVPTKALINHRLSLTTLSKRGDVARRRRG